MHVVAPNEVSTCRPKVPTGEWVRKTYDYVIACNSLRTNITQMEVVEDVESRPHKPVSFVVEGAKETQEWIEQLLPKVLPGCSGGRFQGRSAIEAGGEEEGQQEEKGQRNIRHEIAQKEVASIKEKAGGGRASTTGFATAVTASQVMSHAPGPKDPALPEGTEGLARSISCSDGISLPHR